MTKTIFVVGFLTACGLRSLTGSEREISDRSPDKKYALWQKYADKQPYLGDVKLIDSKNREPVLTLDEQVEPFSKKLLWAKDSQRFAYFNHASHGEGGFTRIFFRDGTTFEEAKLPNLPDPPLRRAATDQKDSETRTRIEPLRWTDAGELVIEKELINEDWGRTALEITRLRFETSSHRDQDRAGDAFDCRLHAPSSTRYLRRTGGRPVGCTLCAQTATSSTRRTAT